MANNELNSEDVSRISQEIDEELEFYIDQAKEVPSGTMEEDYTASSEEDAYVQCAKTILDVIGEDPTDDVVSFSAGYIKDKMKEVGARLEVAADESVSYCWG